MRISHLLALPALFTSACAQALGYNYGALNPDGSPRTYADFVKGFNTAKQLAGATGFTSARLYTMIQAGTANTPTEAIQAAIDTSTTLLLGLWASAGQGGFNNELDALNKAIIAHGTQFTDLIIGISVGSEDLYRISPIGTGTAGDGAQPDTIALYIAELRNVTANTPAASKPIGHVDTSDQWANSSNAAVVAAVDFIGMDAYPYYETANGNDISNALNLFNTAYEKTVAAGQGKPVWVTETGWPTSGPTLSNAVPNAQNAKTFWDQVGCGFLFGKINTWWFTLEDPAFGVVGNTLSTNTLYDLSCPAKSKRRSIGFEA